MCHRQFAFTALAICFSLFNSASAALSGQALVQTSGISGGIVVHVGCDTGERTAALYTNKRLLVHGLDTDSGEVTRAKQHIDSLGLYGKIWAETYDGKNLPHGDNTVNLMIIEEMSALASREIERVLVPRGVVLVKANAALTASKGLTFDGVFDGWSMYTKSWPSGIDEWTHFLYDASGNAVCKDKDVQRPHHLQWFAGPKRTRHHDALASLSAMTSSKGRVFYIFDEGATSLVHRPAFWKLIARDAFNGKLLWKRDIPDWMTHLYNFRAGPQQLPRRLVSVGDSVYTTLGLCAPTVKLDAATGKTLLTYAGSEKTEELIYHNGMLLALIGDPSILIDKSDGSPGYWELAEYEDPTVDKSIIAYDADTGKHLWTVTGDHLRHTAPLSLCALGDNIFYLDNQQLHCVDTRTGAPRWASPFPTEGLFIRSYAPTIVAHNNVIMCLTWNRLYGFSIETGDLLWKNKGAIGFGSPGDLFAIDDTAWIVPMTKAITRENKLNKDGVIINGVPIPKSNFLNQAKTAVGIDIHSGKITDLLPFAHTQHHHRCYRNKATEQYLLLGHSGIQVVDLETKTNETHRWVRGLCQYGIMPANGYLYVPPENCQCYGTGKINGFFALSETNSWASIEHTPVLEKGPGYKAIKNYELGIKNSNDWPSYRANAHRSGATECSVPANPTIKWQTDIGPTITAPVISANKLYVAERDAYTVHCLSSNNGQPIWKYLGNGPIDSPPTIYRGLCLFGCADGSVTCLNAENGQLVWRFKTSKLERRMGYEDHLASPLTIHGSVLVVDDTVYFAAGYSSNLDGGIRLYGLDVRTGMQHYSGKLASGHWGDDGQWGFLADILVSDGETINMRQASFDRQLKPIKKRGLLVASTGLLEDTWYHRQGWSSSEGANGQLIAQGNQRSFSLVSPYTGLKKRRKGQYQQFNQDGHFHQKLTRYEESFFPVGAQIVSKENGREKGKGKNSNVWTKDISLQPRAMVLAGNQLCLAGWMDAIAIEMKTGRPKDPDNPDPRESFLRSYDADTGQQIWQYPLEAEPVFDGLAAANHNLFLSLKNGKLICLGATTADH
jgi:outer membrane protein assembly factor BamB